MRLLKIKISCFDRKQAELFGNDDFENDVPSECVIDLDRVTSVWQNPSGEICIHVGSHQESYWTNTYTLDVFVNLWNNNKGELV